MAKLLDEAAQFFHQKTPAGRPAETEAAIAAAESERSQHQARRPAEIVHKMAGDPAAAARVEAIDAAVAALDIRLRDLHEAKGELSRRIAADEAAARKTEIESRPRRIAELRREYMAAVEQITAHAEALAAALKASTAFSTALVAELGNDSARRFLDFSPRMMRFQAGVARLFAIDPARPLLASNSLLGIASCETGERSHCTPTRHEETGLDDLAPFFFVEAEAEAARDRLAVRNSAVAVLPLPGGCFTLVREENLFGERAAADKAVLAAASRGQPPLAVVGHLGGFALVPQHIAQGAA